MTFLWKSLERGLEDVVAPLDKAEVSEIELAAAASWIGGPGVEIPFVGKVVVDEAGEDSGDEGVAIAVALEIIPDRLRDASDTAGAEECLGIRGTKAGEGDAENARDGLARRI